MLEKQPVICESGALLDYTKPGLFILVKGKGQLSFKKGLNNLAYKPDLWLEFNGETFDVHPDQFIFAQGTWSKIKNPNPSSPLLPDGKEPQ